MVILLDCWSVNTSREFRAWIEEKYPYMRLRFIPAGLTGKFQILPEEVQDEDCEEDDEDDDVDESEDEEAPVPVPQRVEQKDSGDVLCRFVHLKLWRASSNVYRRLINLSSDTRTC